MPSRPAIAIDIGRHTVQAVLASRREGALAVERVLVEPVPAEIEAGDAAAMGSWLGERLGAAGFPRGKATIAVARQLVGLKRLSLPTTDPAELPQMTRLALQRNLPFDAQSAAIDFIVLERSDTSTSVVAVAVPASALAWAEEVAKAAGFGIERISLRGMGAVALLSGFDDGFDGATLAVDITADAVEFCIVAGGGIRFSRAAELAAAESDVARAVVTETRRTWMSYRITEGADGVQRAVIMGDASVAGATITPLREMLQVETTVIDQHPRVDAGGHALDRLWPLAGLLLEPMLGVESIDFAHPRRAPDRAGRRRRRAIIAAGLAVVGLLGAWTVGQARIGRLESTLEVLKKRESALRPQYVRHMRESYRLTHLEHWQAVAPSWLEHARTLVALAPQTSELVLDGWQGSLDFRGVQFDRKSQEFSAPCALTIVLDGEAKDRTTADAFRDALVRSSFYTAESTGADARSGKRLPYGFTYRLRTALVAPPDDAPPADPSRDGASAGTTAQPSTERAP